MKIGILQTGLVAEEMAATHGQYVQIFPKVLADADFDFEGWSIVENVFPDGPFAADAWLVTGSKHGAYEDLPWIPRLEALIREIYDSGRPLVGICFGHQIIAKALGGHVEKFDGGWVAGRERYDFDGKEIHLHAWHQDQVVAPPKDATTIARGQMCDHAALLYGKKAFTVQAHPEFGSDYVQDLIQYRGVGVLPPEILDRAAANLGQPVGNAQLLKMITQFFKTGTLS